MPNICYNIDGVTFETVNADPFVYMTQADEPEYAFYVDSLPQNKVTYIYRIVGKTPFGTYGNHSDTLHVMGWPDPIKGLTVAIDTFTISNNNTQVNLNWSIPDSIDISQIAGYHVMRSNKMLDGYQQVNETIITNQKYTDTEALPIGYYRIDAIDINQHAYPSLIELVQLPDSIPPAAPQGVVAHYISDSDLVIKWNANTEDDFAGYRVLISNQRDGTYQQITSEPTLKLEYQYQTNPEVRADSIFVKVFAQDHRSNYSDHSEAVAVLRPDNVPPSSPVLSKAEPTPEGVKIGWVFAPDDNITQHILQRKVSNGPNWTDILIIPKDNEGDFTPTDTTEIIDTYFTDSDTLQLILYDYRLLAVDTDGDMSSSEIFEVLPYASAIVGEISDFDIDISDEEIEENEIVEGVLNGLRKVHGDVGLRSGGDIIYHIEMQWSYPIDETVTDFVILRGISGGPLVVVKTVSLSQAMGYDSDVDIDIDGDIGVQPLVYQDTEVQKGKRYIYQVMARHIGGTTSQRSQTLTKKIPNE